jgi:hypothetical protein
MTRASSINFAPLLRLRRPQLTRSATNTTLAILAVVSFMAAIYCCGRRDVGGAAAGTVGAVLFAILAIVLGGDHRHDRWDA